MKKFVALLLAVLMVASLCACGQKDTQTASDIKTVTAGKLTMSTNAQFPPYESVADDGKGYEGTGFEGIDIEIAYALAQKLGLELVVDDMDFDSALSAVQTGKSDMVKALKNIRIHPRIHIEEGANGVHFAVNCRHCADPLCVKGCITGALTRQNGMIVIDENKCVGCFTCILSCPYGAIEPDETGHVMQKCELCTKNGAGEPLCVKNCPNQAIVYEER